MNRPTSASHSPSLGESPPFPPARRTRRVVFAGVGAMSAGLLAACGPQAAGSGERKTTESAAITFMNRGGREAFAVHDKVVAAFMEQTPTIQVNAEPVVEGSWSAKLTASLAGGTAADTVMCAFGSFLPFCKRGDILELGQFLSKDRDVRPADWFPLALESMKYKGRLFNMPYNGGTYALFYNKDLFDQERVQYPDDTWTWEKYVEAATQLTTDAAGRHANEAGFDGTNVARYGAHNIESAPSWWYWLWTYGSDLYTKNNTEVNLADPKALDAIQWIADMHKRRIWPSDLFKDPQEMGFRQGNIAMTTWGHWTVARVRTDPFKWDVAPMPKTPDGKRIALGWYSGNGIVSTTKHPEAAWEFLKFFGGAPGQRILGIEGLTLPAVRKVAESDEIMKTSPPDNQRAFLTEIDRARIHIGWNITEVNDWNEILNPALDQVWSGQAKAKDILPALVARLNEV
ncbi:MAG: ABC transporter substrate-binding protein, partial [Chloroflexota bacterium]